MGVLFAKSGNSEYKSHSNVVFPNTTIGSMSFKGVVSVLIIRLISLSAMENIS